MRPGRKSPLQVEGSHALMCIQLFEENEAYLLKYPHKGQGKHLRKDIWALHRRTFAEVRADDFGIHASFIRDAIARCKHLGPDKLRQLAHTRDDFATKLDNIIRLIRKYAK